MNPAEQAERQNRYQRLALAQSQRLDAFEAKVANTLNGFDMERKTDLRKHRDAIGQLRAELAAAQRLARIQLAPLYRPNFWGRLAWLLFGPDALPESDALFPAAAKKPLDSR